MEAAGGAIVAANIASLYGFDVFEMMGDYLILNVERFRAIRSSLLSMDENVKEMSSADINDRAATKMWLTSAKLIKNDLKRSGTAGRLLFSAKSLGNLLSPQ